MDIQVKCKDRSSWAASDQAHYFGYSLSSQETKEESLENRVRQGSPGFEGLGGMGQWVWGGGCLGTWAGQEDPSS